MVRIVLNHRGMAELLKSEGVRRDLTKRAERVKAAAAADDTDYQVTQHTHDRAVVRVEGGEMWDEADKGRLTRALPAAGGE